MQLFVFQSSFEYARTKLPPCGRASVPTVALSCSSGFAIGVSHVLPRVTELVTCPL